MVAADGQIGSRKDKQHFSYNIEKKRTERPTIESVYQQLERCSASKGMLGQ